MEVKVQCECGARFKFDVEPVHGRMPAPAICPECGEDRTSEANEFIRANTAPAPSLAATPSSRPPPPVGLAPPRIVPKTPIARINRPAPETPPAFTPEPAYVPPPLAPMDAGSASPRGRTQKGPLMTALTTVGVVVLIAFGAWRSGSKWFRRIKAVASIATSIAKSTRDGEAAQAKAPRNLWYDNCVVLFIQHTNHMEVADACKAYWKEKLNKSLSLIQPSEDEFQKGVSYQLIPAHNGYVRVISGLDWAQPNYEGLASFLSDKFHSLVFEMRDEDFSGAYHFGVYDHGARKFHAQMDVAIVNGQDKETVKTEGNDWALENGYEPAVGGFNKFDLSAADKITEHMGMKMWDEVEGEEVKFLLLKE